MRPRRSLKCFCFITAVGCHAHLERLARVKQLKENTDDTFNVSSQSGFVALRRPQITLSCVLALFRSSCSPSARLLLVLMDKSHFHQTIVIVIQSCFVLSVVVSRFRLTQGLQTVLYCAVVQT